MWFQNLLLVIVLTTVIADIEKEVEKCKKLIDIDELELLSDFLEEDELHIVCPAFLSFFDCIERAVNDEVGLTLGQLRDSMPESKMKSILTVGINVRGLLKDLCDKDSQLHKDFYAHIDCFRTIDTGELTRLCKREAELAYDTYKQSEGNVQEEAGENTDVDNRPCMTTAYKVACIGVEIKEKCGQQAFDVYRQAFKRSELFRHGICSAEQMETLKFKFLDHLEMESARRELYKLALDMKKRRK